MAVRQPGGGRGSSPAAGSASAEPTVEFAFGAVFTSLLRIPLRAAREDSLIVSDLLPTASGRFWLVDANAAALKIFSPEGHQLGSLQQRATGLRRPVSLASLHGRWIAALDGHLPAVVILDEAGRVLRRFPLPELDRPVQICNLDDRRLAVVGSGWGAGAGRQVHLYTTNGEYIESLFGESRRARKRDRAYVAAAGSAMYLGHSHTDSFAIYDVDAHGVVAFSNLNASVAESRGRYSRSGARLCGLFAASCGPLIAQYAPEAGARDYSYDLYSLDGTPIALGLRSPERVVSLEGPLFYSVRTTERGDNELRVWKLRFEPG
ncbi:MAG: hypothetical protein V3U13_09670 [Gemmatimonadota bacterium]